MASKPVRQAELGEDRVTKQSLVTRSQRLLFFLCEGDSGRILYSQKLLDHYLVGLERLSVPFRCSICGRKHSGLPMDIAFEKPADYFAVPDPERERRCALTADWCVIDDRRFYVRGILYVPVTGTTKEFGWGVWARLSKTAFQRYFELYSADASDEPPFRGYLCNVHCDYEGLDGLEVRVQLRKATERPEFTIVPCRHLLYKEQHSGITMHRVHEILAISFPEEFGGLTDGGS
jgi:hypothetical protein